MIEARRTKVMEGGMERVDRRRWWKLDVILHAAVQIDLPLPDHKEMKTPPSYYVCARVDDRVQITKKRKWSEWATVNWNEALAMVVSSPPTEAFLHLEVVRVGAFQDPGSSKGQTVVGRAIVPVKPFKRLRLPLIKSLGGHGGELFLSLKVKRGAPQPRFDLLA